MWNENCRKGNCMTIGILSADLKDYEISVKSNFGSLNLQRHKDNTYTILDLTIYPIITEKDLRNYDQVVIGENLRQKVDLYMRLQRGCENG